MIKQSDGTIRSTGCSNAHNINNMQAEVSTYHNETGKHVSSVVLGGNQTDVGLTLGATKDGGFILGLKTVAAGNGNEDSVVVKFGEDGDIEQALVLGNSTHNEQIIDIEQAQNSSNILTVGYVFANYSYSN